MVRQTWEGMLARYEPIVVGLAVALFSLVLVAPSGNPVPVSEVATSRDLAVDPQLYAIPTDPQYYRDRWFAETAAFYAAHPASGSPADAAVTANGRAHASIAAQPVRREVVVQEAQPTARRATASGWAITACLLAGAIAAAVFHGVWPVAAVQTTPQSDAIPRPALTQWEPSQGGTYALIIPDQWIAIRPTMGDTLRRCVVGLAYLLAAVGCWQVLQL